MCDDFTEDSNKRWLGAKQLGRREFGAALGVGATAAILLPACGSDSDPAPVKGDESSTDTNPASSGVNAALTSSMVSIVTPDGTADAFFVHPGSGSHPAAILWPDVLGLREALNMMATRLATEGYAVLVVNQYYRTGPAPVLDSWAEFGTPEGRAKLTPLIAALSAEGIVRDAGAFIDWLDKQDAVAKDKKIGTFGYCMGGPFTFRTASSRPDRVGALASFHGGVGLVTEAPTSPHLLIPQLKAAMLVAVAQNDDERQPDGKTVLKAAADEAKLPAEIEVYPAQHGWCPTDSRVYDEAQAEKAWGRMVAVFGEHL